MTEWVEVATLQELRRRKRKLVIIGDTRIALFLVDDRVYALADTCVHKQRSLTKGTVLHGRVICPGHQWAFDLESGRADDRDECQPTHDVRIDDSTVYLDPRPHPAPHRALQEARMSKEP
ncbi:nitrite reductase (NADH) small subunit [Spinactinospora alkalitolerans]|uniref:Nitrite reductase (NADH) small subunit n=1 Tax=Spinactinospora alkalitolerans TaxID=687207 RepID=A0A852TVK7_9ACTN|nr:Rieske 2Fe-2S domain-containing protein [Spinactinospora alkalitolerans]NYE47968.1 nitrite reductase (NADH) small subunit [Spinactinospora alkalitolerans]